MARGPGGVRVEWDAEIINEIQNKVIAWQSLPGGDVVSAGSVNFEPARGARSRHEVTRHAAVPAARRQVRRGWSRALFGSEPSQTIREDLRRFKQLLETGEIAKAAGRGRHVGGSRR